MNFASMFLTLDLLKENNFEDSGNILRRYRDRLLQKYPGKLSVQTSPENSGFLVILSDQQIDKLKARIEKIRIEIESVGEVRIESEKVQIFSWLEDQFFEVSSPHKKVKSNKFIIYSEDEEKPSPIPLRKQLRIPVRRT